MSVPGWVAATRRELLVCQRFAYLNTGTAGPIPERSHQAIRVESKYERRNGRGNFADFKRFGRCRENVRGLLGRLLGAPPETIALTHHTSEGLNIVLWGIDWQPGDVLLTTTLEHDAVVVAAAALSRRRGVDVRFADIGRGERALEGLARHLEARPRLVVLSHVVWSTGARLPIGELVAACHQAGAAVLVDGAQSAGSLPVDVRALGVDYYTVSGQKWLCGPEGTGGLYVRRQRLADLEPTFAAYFSAADHDFRHRCTFHADARRFETGMVYRPALAGFEASLRWILDDITVERAWTRSLEVAAECRQRLAALDGVELLSPDGDLSSPLVAFALSDSSPSQMHAFAFDVARQRNVIIRSVDTAPHALRASCGWFNTSADLAALEEAVAAAVGPA